MTVDELRVLICEDEYLLASDLAYELEARGIVIAGILGRVSEVETALADGAADANAAVLDVQLLDGPSFGLVSLMLARGITVVFCSGYGPQDMPDEFAHVPCVSKPTDIDELLDALRTARMVSAKKASNVDDPSSN